MGLSRAGDKITPSQHPVETATNAPLVREKRRSLLSGLPCQLMSGSSNGISCTFNSVADAFPGRLYGVPCCTYQRTARK